MTQMGTKMQTKALVFVAMMAALGNVLSFLSMQLAPIAPNIPLGPVQVSLAFDLSHLATFIAAFFGGPMIGGLTGLVGGMVAAFEFGFSKGNLVTGIGLPLGKALTGFAAGYIFKLLAIENSKLKLILSTTISYIPEAILTYVLFRYLLPPIMGLPVAIAAAIGVQIIAKAFVEMIILAVILMGMIDNLSFKAFMDNYFQ